MYLSKLQVVFLQIVKCICPKNAAVLGWKQAQSTHLNCPLILCSALCSVWLYSAEQQKQFTSLFDSILCIAMQQSAIFYSAFAKVLKNVHCAGQSIGRLAFGWPGSMKLFGPIALLIGLRPVIQFQHKYF